MAIGYPDIISEYLVATERYECDGVQIVPYLEPAQVAVGGVAHLVLFLQSALDVPIELSLKPELPQTSRFRGTPMLAVGAPEVKINLEPAQAGALFVPVTTTPHAKEGEHAIHLNVSAKAQGQPSRVRPQQAAGRFQSDLIEDVVGLDLARVVGVKYKATSTRKIGVPVTIRGQAETSGEAPNLSTRFEALWAVEAADRQGQALQEINQRRAVIIEQLQIEPLFVGLFVEGQKRFAEADLPLRIGEAIALGKILTYTVRHFLVSTDLQDGLLVPIWELANQYDLPTGDPLWVLHNVGFQHVLRLSVALSFGLIRRALGRHPWNLEERRAVTSLVANTVEARQPLSPEFLYIPLLIAAAYISRQITLEGEDSKHSLKLLQKAKAARADIFTDPDLAEANLLFDRLTNAALQT